MIKKIRQFVLMLSQPKWVFYILLWLMVLLVAGTVAQKYIGLFRAQEIFFSSLILWLGPVPFPGGLVTLGAFTICLLAKMIFASPWRWQNAGTLVTHAGALLLLLGGLLTFVHAQDGNMVLYEGDRADYFSDYHVRELVVEKDGQTFMTFSWETLEPGAVFKVDGLMIEVVKICRNCAFVSRGLAEDDLQLSEFRGRARNFDIEPAPLEMEDEANRAAIQFRVTGAGDAQDGIYFSTDFIDVSPSVTVDETVYNVALRKAQTPLPFSIELVKFEKEYHPGTSKARSYQSEVILREGDVEWRSLIKMNEPLRYRGYTFYQSSFIDTGEAQASVLAVVKNAGRMFPYIASIVMCIGLLLHMAVYWPKMVQKAAPRKILLVAMVAGSVFGLAQTAHAQSMDYHFFSQIPVLDQGRVKPLDTFARTYLEMFNGYDALPGMSANAWLAETIFDPYKAYDRPIFNISNPAVVDALGLERRPVHRYSYRELASAVAVHYKTVQPLLQSSEDDLSLPQKQLVELFEKIRVYADISRSLSLVFPDFVVPEGVLAERLGIPPGTVVTYLELRRFRDDIIEIAEPVFAKSEDEGQELSEEEHAIIDFSLKLNQVGRDRISQILRVIPPQWRDDVEGMPEGVQGDLWYSPWNITFFGQGSPDSSVFIEKWAELVSAYRAGDVETWNRLTDDIDNFSLKMAGDSASRQMLSLEVFFNNWQPFEISLAFYIVAFLMVMASFLVFPVWFRSAAFGLLLAGLAFHVSGIGVRMWIMGRPPVTNLYESILFVGLVVSLLGAILEGRLKNRMGLVIAAFVGSLLHFLGMKFDAEGDTMGMLVAVLDTNFWLATHVVTITIGYGICLVAGVLGHIYLFGSFFRPQDKEALRALYKNMLGVVYVALFFASLGTILGGIWADQSWGRFWGWDPKENGALLIVLWLVWLLHGKISGKMQALGFSAGLACTNIIVAIAWFGVNLLNVGLHSYGFTQSASVVFVGFCICEVILVFGLYGLIRFHQKDAVAL